MTLLPRSCQESNNGISPARALLDGSSPGELMSEDTKKVDSLSQGPGLPWRGIQGLIHVLTCHSQCREARVGRQEPAETQD